MRLSDHEKLILATAELRADSTVRELSAETGLPEHTVRYHLRKLQDAGVIGPKRPVIDMNLLGFVHYTFFFSLSSGSQKSKQQLLQKLLRSEQVTWMFELGGDYQYGLSLSVKHVSEVGRFLEGITIEFGNIFFSKTFSIQLAFAYFGRRYLGPSPPSVSPPLFQVTDRTETIDDLDERILSAMANARAGTLTDLARHLDVPIATLERRKKRLEDRSIIRGYFYWIDASRLKMQSYVVLIYMKGINPAFKERLVKFSRREPRVVYYLECMGDWDFELGVEVEDAKLVTSLTQKLYDQFSEDLLTIKVVPILSYLKFKSFPEVKGNNNRAT